MGASEQTYGAQSFSESLEGAVFPEVGPSRLDHRGLDVLRATIEGEIIPRLMLAHRAMRPAAHGGRAERGSHVSVEELTRLALAAESAALVERVRALRDGGVSVERVLLEVLAPTAKRLGELWVADLCTFTEVTVALGRLQYLVRDLSLAEAEAPAAAGRRALIVATPGEQHTFGAAIVAEFLRRDGWDVCSEPCATTRELAVAVREATYELLGLSLSVDRSIDGLESNIVAARRESANPALSVMVGGRVFDGRPGLAADVGADGTAGDATTVAATAAALVALRAVHE
jgi:methanogenic corrinoid protein MtbC1